MDNPSVTLIQRQGYQFEHHYAPEIPVLLADEPPPIGTGLGPDPVELLASAVGNCLSASIWFACQKYKDDPSPLRTEVKATVGKNERGRNRVQGLAVDLHLGKHGVRLLDPISNYTGSAADLLALEDYFECRALGRTLPALTQGAIALRKKMIDGATNAQLNTYGYTLANQGRMDEAVKIFELNAKRHADDPNVHDSLGEGYMMVGNTDAAIKAFKKSLSMNPPENVRANSIKCLKKLGVDTSAYEKTASAVKTGM